MSKNDNKIFNERLRSLMNKNNIGIIKLAAETNISKTTLNNWLNKQINVRKTKHLITLSKYFRCAVDYLLGLEDDFGNKID